MQWLDVGTNSENVIESEGTISSAFVFFYFLIERTGQKTGP